MVRPRSKTKAEKVLDLVNPRMQAFLRGEIKVEDLDDDEISRGQLKAADGTFRGRPSYADVVPREFATAVAKELRKRIQQKFQAQALRGVEVIGEVMENGEGEGYGPGQHSGTKRLDAAKYVVERVIGKIPDKLEVEASVSVWGQMQESGELWVDVEEAPDDTEDAEIVPEEDVPQAPERRALTAQPADAPSEPKPYDPAQDPKSPRALRNRRVR